MMTFWLCCNLLIAHKRSHSGRSAYRTRTLGPGIISDGGDTVYQVFAYFVFLFHPSVFAFSSPFPTLQVVHSQSLIPRTMDVCQGFQKISRIFSVIRRRRGHYVCSISPQPVFRDIQPESAFDQSIHMAAKPCN